MAVPLIQGTIRYADIPIVDKLNRKKEKILYLFAATVHPHVHSCRPEDAEIIYSNLKVGVPSTTLSAV